MTAVQKAIASLVTILQPRIVASMLISGRTIDLISTWPLFAFRNAFSSHLVESNINTTLLFAHHQFVPQLLEEILWFGIPLVGFLMSSKYRISKLTLGFYCFLFGCFSLAAAIHNSIWYLFNLK